MQMIRKPRLVLHIGMHKTGSTSLQRFFVRNRILLRALGIHYPKATGADGRRLPKHNDIFLAVSHEMAHKGAPHPTLGPSAARIREVERHLHPGRVTLLSAEGLSGQKPGFAKALAPLAEAADVRVVCFLRRQDDWIKSFYKQMVLSREVRETRTFDEFLALPRTHRHLDYAKILRWWANAFGSENIRVLIYPPRQSILIDFLTAAELPLMLRHFPYSDCKQNISLPSSYIERVRLANLTNQPLPLPDDSDNNKTIMSEASLRALLESCSMGNEWIRSTFRPDLPTLFE
jgi:hypothetical protein